MRGERQQAVESLILSRVASGMVSHSELVKTIVDTLCCSAAEAEAMIRSMASRGLLRQVRVGGRVFWRASS
jgi:hypothetical protein